MWSWAHYSLNHLFSHFSEYCGWVMQNKAWALIRALIPGTIAKIMRNPLHWQCLATPCQKQDKYWCRCWNNHLLCICRCPGRSWSSLWILRNNGSLLSVWSANSFLKLTIFKKKNVSKWISQFLPSLRKLQYHNITNSWWFLKILSLELWLISVLYLGETEADGELGLCFEASPTLAILSSFLIWNFLPLLSLLAAL